MADDNQRYSETSLGFKIAVVIGGIAGVAAVLYGLSMLLESGGGKQNSSIAETRAGITSAKAGEVTSEYAELAQEKYDKEYSQARRSGGESVMPSAIGQGGFVSNASSFLNQAQLNAESL